MNDMLLASLEAQYERAMEEAVDRYYEEQRENEFHYIHCLCRDWMIKNKLRLLNKKLILVRR